MADDRKRKSHGGGVYSLWSKKQDCRSYRIQYHWTGPANGKPTRVDEAVPPDRDGRYLLKSAHRLKAQRERQKNAPAFVPPPIAKKRKRAQYAADQAQAQGDPSRRS